MFPCYKNVLDLELLIVINSAIELSFELNTCMLSNNNVLLYCFSNTVHLPAKLSTTCFTHNSVKSGTVASDQSGSSAMIRRILLLSAAALLLALVRGDGIDFLVLFALP